MKIKSEYPLVSQILSLTRLFSGKCARRHRRWVPDAGNHLLVVETGQRSRLPREQPC